MIGDTYSKKYKFDNIPEVIVIFSAENIMVTSGLSHRNVTKLFTSRQNIPLRSRLVKENLNKSLVCHLIFCYILVIGICCLQGYASSFFCKTYFHHFVVDVQPRHYGVV